MQNTGVLTLAVRNDCRRFYLPKYEKEVNGMHCISYTGSKEDTYGNTDNERRRTEIYL